MKKQGLILFSLAIMLLLIDCSGESVKLPPLLSNGQDTASEVTSGQSVVVDDISGLCTSADMVWYTDGIETRRDYNCSSEQESASGFCYDFTADLCSGYRCAVGNEVSPSCYSETDCNGSCGGTCLFVQDMRTQCAPDLCTSTDMVWYTDGIETRRDYNCSSGQESTSGFCYSFSSDRCSGYRCLNGSEIMPACYSQTDCQAVCGGTCVFIQDVSMQCGS